MESLNSQDVHFDYERYIDICWCRMANKLNKYHFYHFFYYFLDDYCKILR